MDHISIRKIFCYSSKFLCTVKWFQCTLLDTRVHFWYKQLQRRKMNINIIRNFLWSVIIIRRKQNNIIDEYGLLKYKIVFLVWSTVFKKLVCVLGKNQISSARLSLNQQVINTCFRQKPLFIRRRQVCHDILQQS